MQSRAYAAVVVAVAAVVVVVVVVALLWISTAHTADYQVVAQHNYSSFMVCKFNPISMQDFEATADGRRCNLNAPDKTNAGGFYAASCWLVTLLIWEVLYLPNLQWDDWYVRTCCPPPTLIRTCGVFDVPC
jgi:hypothetical protein